MIPSLNVTIEPEMQAAMPEGVSVHVTRLMLPAGTVEHLERFADDTEEAARLLATARVQAIAFACTSGSLMGGAGYDAAITARIEAATGIPATTTSTAVLDAFRALGVHSVAVGTPYVEAVNDRERAFLETHGMTVAAIEGWGYTEGEDLHREPLERTMALARAVDRPEAEAIFLSCTDLKTLPILAALEEERRKPVVSSVSATLWALLRLLKIADPLAGVGTLLAVPR